MDLWLGCGYGDTYNFPPNMVGKKKELAINNTRKEKGWSNRHEKKMPKVVNML